MGDDADFAHCVAVAAGQAGTKRPEGGGGKVEDGSGSPAVRLCQA